MIELVRYGVDTHTCTVIEVRTKKQTNLQPVTYSKYLRMTAGYMQQKTSKAGSRDCNFQYHSWLQHN